MRSISISVPDEVYQRMEVRAAELATTLATLVREYLMKADYGSKRDFDRGKRLQEETLSAIGIFHGADRLSRDEIHDRDVLR